MKGSLLQSDCQDLRDSHFFPFRLLACHSVFKLAKTDQKRDTITLRIIESCDQIYRTGLGLRDITVSTNFGTVVRAHSKLLHRVES